MTQGRTTMIATATLTVPMQDLTADQVFALIADAHYPGARVLELDGKATVFLELNDDGTRLDELTHPLLEDTPPFAERIDQIAEELGFDVEASAEYTAKQWKALTS